MPIYRKSHRFMLTPFAALALVASCASPEPESKVDVPEVKGAVLAADFCDLADEISCAGALGCCADPEFSGIDECVQNSLCADGLGAVLTSQAVADGAVKYDSEAAGEYLRTLASVTSSCGGHPAELARPTFLYGARGVGEDCSPADGDPSNTFSCASGLQCDVKVDPDTKIPVGTCTEISAATPPGAEGAACSSGEDCNSGTCTNGACEADLESQYCINKPLPEAPPSNATPTHLYIDLSGSNSGTTGNITIAYSKSNVYYECTITDTLSDGQEKVCAVSKTGVANGPAAQFFDIEMNSSDGARIDTVCACSEANTSTNKCTSEIECAGTFNKAGTSKPSWCSDASFNVWLWANACKKIWLDSNGNGNCTHFEIDADDDNNITCES
ncbi:MAG: hypothetical protein R3B09_29870 [Nannocystaceae bacterium]